MTLIVPVNVMKMFNRIQVEEEIGDDENQIEHLVVIQNYNIIPGSLRFIFK